LPHGRREWIRAGSILGVPLLSLTAAGLWMIPMPGHSHEGPLPVFTTSQTAIRDRLRRRVEFLAKAIGPRGIHSPGTMERTAAWLEGEFRAAGCEPRRRSFPARGAVVANVEAEIPGGDRAEEILVVGAHYDTDAGCPGANDNGTGVAALLEIAAALRPRTPACTVRLVAFANEEPPFFQREGMGSMAAARASRAKGEKIRGMISLETIGYYSDAEGSQKYPFPFALFYPSKGNFISFVGNVGSRNLVRESVASFRSRAAFPSVGAALPSTIPGIGLSDHWSYWQVGYPALMVTDTAPFRYEQYHTGGDTPDRVDFERTARVVEGLAAVVGDLAGTPAAPR